MQVLIHLGIYLCFILVGLGIVAILGFGIRGLRNEKVNPVSAALIGAPLVLAILLGLIAGDWVKGAIIACMIIFSIALLAVVVNGIRGFVST